MTWIYFFWFMLPSILFSMIRIFLRPLVWGGLQRSIAFVGITLWAFIYYYVEN